MRSWIIQKSHPKSETKPVHTRRDPGYNHHVMKRCDQSLILHHWPLFCSDHYSLISRCERSWRNQQRSLQPDWKSRPTGSLEKWNPTSAEQPVRSYLVSENPPLHQQNRQLLTCRLWEHQQVSRGSEMLHKFPSCTFWSDPCMRIKQGAHYVVLKCGADLFTPRRDNGLICLQLKGPQTQNNLDSIIRRAGGALRQPPVDAPHRGRAGNTGEVTVFPPHTHKDEKVAKDVCFINYL